MTHQLSQPVMEAVNYLLRDGLQAGAAPINTKAHMTQWDAQAGRVRQTVDVGVSRYTPILSAPKSLDSLRATGCGGIRLKVLDLGESQTIRATEVIKGAVISWVKRRRTRKPIYDPVVALE